MSDPGRQDATTLPPGPAQMQGVGQRRNSLLLILVFAFAVDSCDSSRPPLGPTNHYPAIVSLTVVPTEIGTSDSAVVTCVATDQDNDTLVYDWETDLRLRISGNPPDLPIKSNTSTNAEAFYPNYQPTQVDTVWVACTVRDRRGGGAGKAIKFTVHP